MSKHKKKNANETNDNVPDNLTLYEREFYGDTEEKEETRQMIIFKLGSEWYGIDIINVSEVVPLTTITPLPSVPNYIEGIFNLRGNIVSATDLKSFFGLTKSSISENNRIIVITHKGISTGLLVDGSEQTIEVPLSKIEEPMVTLEDEKNSMIEAQAGIDGKLIAILSAPRIIEKTRLTPSNT